MDNNGEVIGVTSLIQDNTERKLLEEKVNQSQKLEAVGQLTGGIAHDFNNLMAVMMGNLELTLEQLEPKAPIRDKIENALRAVERGARLTKQLLSFSRRQVLSPSRIDIQKLVDETVTFLERTLGASIEIKREYTAEEILVDIDGDIFGNALVNLSLNARDAMPDGGVLTFQVSKIMPETRAAELNEGAAPRPYVCIKVSDTGDGMSENVMEQVFEPFFTTKDVGKGSGLGLSMVYGFVSQSDGHMEITSQEGEGTEISIYFPIPDQD